MQRKLWVFRENAIALVLRVLQFGIKIPGENLSKVLPLLPGREFTLITKVLQGEKELLPLLPHPSSPSGRRTDLYAKKNPARRAGRGGGR